MNKRMVAKLTEEIKKALFAGDWVNIPVEKNSSKFEIYNKALEDDIKEAINEVMKDEKRLERLGINEEEVEWLVKSISNHNKKDEIAYILSNMAARVFEENWRNRICCEDDGTDDIAHTLNSWLIDAEEYTAKYTACSAIISSLEFSTVLDVFENVDEYIEKVSTFEGKLKKIEDQQWCEVIVKSK